jgi:tetratricopeptide (TPR) repeat protein
MGRDHNSKSLDDEGSIMTDFAESSRRRTRRLAILSLAVTAALAWSLPSQAFDLGGDDDKPAKKCPSGKTWNEQKKKCESLKSGDLSNEDLARAGRQLARDGHYQDAIKVLELVKRKDDPVVLTYLGYSHRKLGEVDLGITLYKQALDIDPENVDTREYLGEGYVTTGKLDLARLELSEIEKRCGTTCEEYQELHKVLRSATSVKP